MKLESSPARTLAVQFGRKRIVYRLQYSARKTLAIDVLPDLSVVVTAPAGSEDTAVEKRVKKRAAWIVQQQRFFENYLPVLPPRRYVSGESHRYLGRQYRLRVTQGDVERVMMGRGQISVTTVDTANSKRVRALVTRWFRVRAEVIIGEIFAESSSRAGRLGIHALSFKVHKMRNRWGSCTKQGNILLNPELIIAPKVCIEYVISHELCHLKEHNHSDGFYRLLNKLMPDWEVRRERLNHFMNS